jgi:immune inhibitor A
MAAPDAASANSVAIGVLPQGNLPHLVRPRDEVAAQQMEQLSLPTPGAGPQAPEADQKSWRHAFAKHSRVWDSPEQERIALAREAALTREAAAAPPGAAASAPPPARAISPVTATVFALAVDFGSTETLTVWARLPQGGWAIQNLPFSGPRRGQMAPPGPRDNNSIWYDPSLTADPAYYGNLIFGRTGAGRVRMDLTDPTDGQPGINLAGYTVQDYYDHVAGPGNVTVQGTVQGWVTVNHSEAYYGAPYVPTGDADNGAMLSDGSEVPVAQLVVDAADKFNAAHPDFDWSAYDTDHDGFVDTFWIIHAGAGQESGGGAQGADAIWSHSWDLRNYGQWPNGYLVHAGDPVTHEGDIRIGPYTMQPENLGVGVLCEEFGHNFFGLPDLYTVDVPNSIAFWSIMSAGAWGGPLGGAVPVGMPLWFRMIATTTAGPCNWQEPMVSRSLADAPQDVTIGQLEDPPAGTMKGVQVVLPDQEHLVGNYAGSGKCAATGSGRDNLFMTMQRSLDVPADGAGILELSTYWDTETGYDFGYVLVNDVPIADMDGFTDSWNPFGLNANHGLTGFGWGTLDFDLSAYRGQTVQLGFRYITDGSITHPGWWVDDIWLDDTLVDNFERTTEGGSFPGWTNSDPGWLVAPYTTSTPHYYLMEWRAATRYDASLQTAYVTDFVTSSEWSVERVPYNIPGALLYCRDSRYSSTYYLSNNDYDPPSIGSKYQLLVVDMNFKPLVLTGTQMRIDTAGGSYDATLALQPAQTFTISNVTGTTGTWTFDPLPPVATFDDTQGYSAGLFAQDPYDGSLYWSNQGGSCVIPARGVYSTRVTHADGSPATEFYGQIFAGLPLGSGNPADAGVQYGARIELLSKSPAGDSGVVRFLKTPAPVSASGMVRTASGDPLTGVTVTVTADGAGGSGATDAAGHYTTDLVPGWTGHLTPQAPGYHFVPACIALSGANQPLAGLDFTALPLPDDLSPYYDFRYLPDGVTLGIQGTDYALEGGGLRTITSSATSATLHIAPSRQYRGTPAADLPPVRFVRHAGILNRFVTEADVLSLEVSDTVAEVTARNAHVESVSAGGIRRLSMTDFVDAAATAPAAWPHTSVLTYAPPGISLPLRIDLIGVILQSLDTNQKVVSLNTITRRTHRGVSLAGVGNVASGDPEFFPADNFVRVGSLGSLVARGASIQPAWLWSDGGVGRIEATALNVRGTVWGGAIGLADNDVGTQFFATEFGTIRGDAGVHAYFVAGANGDGSPAYTGSIRRIATKPRGGTLTGAAYVAPDTKIRFAPDQGAFVVHTAP